MSSYFTNGETEGQRSGLPKVIPPMSSRVQVHALLTAPAVPCSAGLDKRIPQVPKDTSYWGIRLPGSPVARVSPCLTRPPVC